MNIIALVLNNVEPRLPNELVLKIHSFYNCELIGELMYVCDDLETHRSIIQEELEMLDLPVIWECERGNFWINSLLIDEETTWLEEIIKDYQRDYGIYKKLQHTIDCMAWCGRQEYLYYQSIRLDYDWYCNIIINDNMEPEELIGWQITYTYVDNEYYW